MLKKAMIHLFWYIGLSSEQHDKHVRTRFVEELIRGMGHDIGAPARHIVHFAEMLSEQAVNVPLEDKHERWLGMIQDSGRQIQAMLASLAKLSRLSVRSNKLEQLDLRGIFDKQVAFHQEHSVSNDVQVNITLNSEWPEVMGSGEHWSTLFSNLLENACKFQPVDSEHVIQIAAYCEYDNSGLRFVIEDNGIGVRETQWQDIARPFKRLHSTDDYVGVGMGLAYCDFIAELNDATLSFDASELGGLRVTYCQPNVQLATSNISSIEGL